MLSTLYSITHVSAIACFTIIICCKIDCPCWKIPQKRDIKTTIQSTDAFLLPNPWKCTCKQKHVNTADQHYFFPNNSPLYTCLQFPCKGWHQLQLSLGFEVVSWQRLVDKWLLKILHQPLHQQVNAECSHVVVYEYRVCWFVNRSHERNSFPNSVPLRKTFIPFGGSAHELNSWTRI